VALALAPRQTTPYRFRIPSTALHARTMAAATAHLSVPHHLPRSRGPVTSLGCASPPIACPATAANARHGWSPRTSRVTRQGQKRGQVGLPHAQKLEPGQKVFDGMQVTTFNVLAPCYRRLKQPSGEVAMESLFPDVYLERQARIVGMLSDVASSVLCLQVEKRFAPKKPTTCF